MAARLPPVRVTWMALQPATASPTRAPRPARLQPEVVAARARLSQGTTLRPEFEYELLATFARHERQALITIPTLAVIAVFALLFWAPNQLQALGWCALVIATKFFMTEACRQFLATPREAIKLDATRRHLVLIELVSGCSWAGMALVAATTADTASHVFVLAALIVLLAIRMTFASTVMPILYAGTIPMTLAVFVRLSIQGDLFHVAMAFMALGLQVYFIVLARDLYSREVRLLESRARTDSLIAELEEQQIIANEARLRAEDANLAKSKFLATMSHELRTPLNAILGFSEVMHTELLGPLHNPQYKEYTADIHASGTHLLQLINEILDLSRIEAGRYELSEEQVRIGEIVDDVLRLMKLKAEGKGLTLTRRVPEHLPALWADVRAVRQVLLNLLSNAVKFTPRGGRVTVMVEPLADGGLQLSVADTGPGIPAAELPKVMEAFGQGTLAHQIAEGGTGLGLPIVRSLVMLHGGTFELQSELRRGTVGIVRFPAARVMAPMRPILPLGEERHKVRRRWSIIAAETPERPRRPRLFRLRERA
jgi:two-component system cell cycle sensor histidine kinase PleC